MWTGARTTRSALDCLCQSCMRRGAELRCRLLPSPQECPARGQLGCPWQNDKFMPCFASLPELLAQLQLITQHEGIQSALPCWPSPPACLTMSFTLRPVHLLALQTICSKISACSTSRSCFAPASMPLRECTGACKNLHGTPASLLQLHCFNLILNLFPSMQHLEVWVALCGFLILLITLLLQLCIAFMACSKQCSILADGLLLSPAVSNKVAHRHYLMPTAAGDLDEPLADV